MLTQVVSKGAGGTNPLDLAYRSVAPAVTATGHFCGVEEGLLGGLISRTCWFESSPRN